MSAGPKQRERRTRRTALDVFYELGVILKGVDGAIELLVGVILLIAPTVPHRALSAVAQEAAEGSSPIRQFVAGYVENLDDRLLHTGIALLVAFLIVHGVVKLVLVYCLLRKLHRAYPYALAVLIAFFCYQLFVAVTAPTVGLTLLTALDAAIIVLVYKEYRRLRPVATDVTKAARRG